MLVVKQGTLTLQSDADNMHYSEHQPFQVKAQPEYYEVPVTDAEGNTVSHVKWQGTYSLMSNDECTDSHAYIIQSDGTFRRISNQSADYSKIAIQTFRSFYSAEDVLEQNAYKMMFHYQEQGDEHYPIEAFPADRFDDEDDMPAYSENDIVTGITSVMRLVDRDGTARYYDLQGRPLSGRPTMRGIYVNEGRKVVVR